MNKLRKISLRIILPFILLIVFTVLQGSVFLLEYRQQQATLYEETEKTIKSIMGELQTSLYYSLMRLDAAQAHNIVSTAALDVNFKRVSVIDENQKIVLSNRFKQKNEQATEQLKNYSVALFNRALKDNKFVVDYNETTKELTAYAPLQTIDTNNSFNRQSNAVIFIRYSLKSAFSEQTVQLKFVLVKISIALFASLFLLIYIINRLVLLPLKDLAQSTKITDLSNTVKIKQSGLGEVGLLQRAFAKLVHEVSGNINRLSASEQRWLYALRGARDGVWDWDISNDKVYYSTRWKEMLGYHKDDVETDISEWEDRIHQDDLFNVFQDLQFHFSGRNSFFENTHRILCHNGEYRWILSRGQAVSWDEEGNPLRVIGTNTDVTSYKDTHEKFTFQSQFDEVTQLPNRAQLITHIEQENLRSKNNGMRGAIIFIDCNQYKTINDLKGHSKGDELLYLIARRLDDNKSGPDFIAHLQGSEFVAILPDLHANAERAAEMALDFAKQLDVALKQPFEMPDSDEELVLSGVYGITMFPNEDTEANDLLRQSAMAMKNAQDSEFGNISFFAKQIEEKIHRSHILQHQIRRGLENEEFTLYFQPRVDTNGNLVGAEALSRWFRGDQGWINPAEFIPIAEDSGLIIPLGDWVIHNVFKQLKIWMDQGLPPHFKALSLNVSPKQLLQEDFVDCVEKHLISSGVDANLVEIEITENILVSHMDMIISKLNKLRALGFRFAIDDFGTGYSSFSYLSVLPVSTLKIDQSFIVNLLQEENQQVIVGAIIGMAEALNLEVVAEGVENAEQLDFLIAKGCHQFQGYFVGTPLAIKDFQTVLTNENLKLNKIEGE